MNPKLIGITISCIGTIRSKAADNTTGNSSVSAWTGPGYSSVICTVPYLKASDIPAERITDNASNPIRATGNIALIDALEHITVCRFSIATMIMHKTYDTAGIN